ncbi:MAG: GDP-mannose 4,6-dehydratase [Planctomycetes bacterium]|nr:GDP-mannose 4,6-dehydratase [Planctomycetota bacterium]
METVLITGGAGFIGSHLAARLLSEGRSVCCLDNFDPFYPAEVKARNLEPLRCQPRFRLVEGDIRVDGDVRRALDGCAVVVHLAARAGVRPSLEQPALYAGVNVEGTVCLLEACRRAGVKRFVFGSSSSVYGESPKVPFSEADAVEHPISPYAASKRAGELYAYTYHHLYGLEVNALRFFTVYGPRQRPDLAIHHFTRRIDRGETVTLFGDGSSQRDYTYVDDILDGVVKSLDNWEGYQIYNLGESRTVELRYLVRLIEENLGRKARIEYRPAQPGDVPRTYADISKARVRLGYQPRVPIEEGIRRFVEWYRAKG